MSLHIFIILREKAVCCTFTPTNARQTNLLVLDEAPLPIGEQQAGANGLRIVCQYSCGLGN